jgi:hypothetical protein
VNAEPILEGIQALFWALKENQDAISVTEAKKIEGDLREIGSWVVACRTLLETE